MTPEIRTPHYLAPEIRRPSVIRALELVSRVFVIEGFYYVEIYLHMCLPYAVRGSFRKIPKGGGGKSTSEDILVWGGGGGGIRIVSSIQF